MINKGLLHKFFEGKTSISEELTIRNWMDENPENSAFFFNERKLYDAVLLNKNTSINIRSKQKKLITWSSFINVAAAVLFLITTGLLINKHLESKNTDNQLHTLIDCLQFHFSFSQKLFCVEDLIGEGVTQQMIRSGWYDGYEEMCLFQEFVDKFLMIDGEPIESSPLYDPENPFENRDPRLYSTVLLPGYSVINGKTFQGHPDSLATLGYTNSGITGYSINKFVDWEYDGNWMKYGGDYILMRYAEVLLSFLESKIEAGDVITQNLLDATINKVRGRAEINMIPVTETNPDKLREIVRRERVVELCFEGGLRYWDLIRWGIAKEVLDNTFHGMKLTDNPSSYTKYNVNDKGYLISAKRNFNDHNYLWPIPLSELDVNTNLTQNPGYN